MTIFQNIVSVQGQDEISSKTKSHSSTDTFQDVSETSQSEDTSNEILGIPYRSIEAFYTFGKKLGSGISGDVYSCKHKETGELFACKKILKSRLRTPLSLDNIRNEVNALKSVGSHPAVTSLKEVFEDRKSIHLIMDLCSGGDLFSRVKMLKTYSECDAARTCRVLASMLHYCHSKGIMHRDLKPENILLVSRKSHTAVKVADFGHAIPVVEGEPLTHPAGTLYYIAPEVLDCSYGKEADVWSAGVILYILLTGLPPFWGKDKPAVFKQIKSGVYDMESHIWDNVSLEAKDLVRKMMCLNPEQRITPEGIKRHPWIRMHCLDQSTLMTPKKPTPLSIPENCEGRGESVSTPGMPPLPPSAGSRKKNNQLNRFSMTPTAEEPRVALKKPWKSEENLLQGSAERKQEKFITVKDEGNKEANADHMNGKTRSVERRKSYKGSQIFGCMRGNIAMLECELEDDREDLVGSQEVGDRKELEDRSRALLDLKEPSRTAKKIHRATSFTSLLSNPIFGSKNQIIPISPSRLLRRFSLRELRNR